jgi:DNA-directed RNA polymerase subunit beta'
MMDDKGSVVQTFAYAIHGRYPADDVKDPATGEILFSRDDMMVGKDAAGLEAKGIHEVRIRSVLDCEATSGVCAKCYGMNLASGGPVNIGEAVGVIAAQSIVSPVLSLQCVPSIPAASPATISLRSSQS